MLAPAVSPLSSPASPGSPSRPDPLFARLQAVIDAELDDLLTIEDERWLDPTWAVARAKVRAYVKRPGKRIRPLLVLLGHALADARGYGDLRAVRFAAATELLHAFMLVHDDVADRADTRRGEPALHKVLGQDRHGEDLAIVAGDHLFARAIEAMLTTSHPRAGRAAAYTLEVCRHTAAGQFLDLTTSRLPLGQVTLFQTLKVAQLKTARYGFVAPLVTGALLGGGSEDLVEQLARAGRAAGVAYQLRDDLLGLFGEEAVTGKPAGADLAEGKRTFPVIAAWLRANEADQQELERLWDARQADPASLERARLLVERNGGRTAAERVIERSTRSARRFVAALPALPARDFLLNTLGALEKRAA